MGRKRTPKPQQIERDRQVLELRRGGATWDQIAQVVGFSNPGSAHKSYQRAMKLTLQQPADELRNAEVDRLDRLQRAFWNDALEGNVRAADLILRIIDKRAKILGLEAPVKVQAEVVNYDGHAVDAEVERLAYYLRGVVESSPLALEAGTSENGTTTTDR